MLRLAFLGDRFSDQLDQADSELLDGLEVVWSGSDRSRFVAVGMQRKPHVLVLEASQLDANDMEGDLDRLTRAVDPELVLVIYSFLRRDAVASIQDERTRAIQGPVPLAALRSQMLSLIVREMLRRPDATPQRSLCPTCGQPISGDSTFDPSTASSS